MVYSVNGLSGDFETVSHTIGALIQRSWTKANTRNVLPEFNYDQEKSHEMPTSELTNYVKVEETGGSGFNPVDSALDDSQGTFDEDILITVNTESQILGRLFENEIVNIMRTNFRATINKADNTNASGIKRWIWPLPQFTRISLGEQRKSYKSQMLLTVKSHYEWSD
jgi:hypothetical protein